MRLYRLRQTSPAWARATERRLLGLVGLGLLPLGMFILFLGLLSRSEEWRGAVVYDVTFSRTSEPGKPSLVPFHTLRSHEDFLPDFSDRPPGIRVSLEFNLHPDGGVSEVRLRRSSGDSLADARARAQVQKWQFGTLPEGYEPKPERVQVTFATVSGLTGEVKHLLLRLFGLLFALFAASFLLRWRAPRAHPVLFPVAAALGVIGWLLLWRLAPDLALKRNEVELLDLPVKQWWFLLLGLGVMVAVAGYFQQRGPALLLSFRRTAYAWWLVGIGLILLTGWTPLGTDLGTGHRLWLRRLGPLPAVQTVELVKIILLLFAAARLTETLETPLEARSWQRWWGQYGPLLLACALALLPIIAMRDFGPVFLLLLTFLGLLLLRGQWAAAGGGAALLGVLMVAAYHLGFPARWRFRVEAWRDPFQVSENLARSLWALSAGGWRGVGLGLGLPHDVPVVQSDFNFAALAEELGFLGGLGVLALLFLLIACGFNIARRSTNLDAKLVAAGVTVLFAVQSFILLGGVLMLLPFTGITLPFISYGGTSLLLNFALVGLLLGLSAVPEESVPEAVQVRGREVNRYTVGVQIGVAALFLLLTGRLFQLEILRGRELQQRVYSNQRLLNRIRALIAEGSLRADENDRLLLSPAVKASLPPAVQRQIRQLIAADSLYADRGRVILEPGAGLIRNPRLARLEERIVRGEIRDREGKVVATNRLEAGRRRRVYPEGPRFAHTVGYLHPRYGKGGLERALNQVLLGLWGQSLFDRTRQWVRQEPRGSEVILTLDAELQRLAYDLLGERRGAIVLLEVKTGAILVAADWPTLDPNEPDPHRWREWRRHPGQPFLQRWYRERYPPGSAFKPLVAAAALESGTMTPTDTLTCAGTYQPLGRGYAVRDFQMKRRGFRGHGRVNLQEMLVHSCNCGFAQVGVKLGAERLFAYARRAGLYRNFTLIPPKAAPKASPLMVSAASVLYPGADAPEEIPPGKFTSTHLAQSAIGQYNVRVTPLFMALFAGAIANQGAMMQPTLVREIVEPSGDTVWRHVPQVWERVMSPATAEFLKEALVAVVERGTGTPARLSGVTVAAKTGTPELPGGRTHAWLVGFAPAEKPEVAFAILIEGGKGGGRTCGPLAKRLLRAALHPLARAASLSRP